MKTSTKLFIAAIFVLFGTTAAYDLALKEAYDKGNYRDSMSDYSRLEYKNFDEVIINSAHFVGTEIIYSDSFDVRIENSVKDHVKVSKLGSQLVIDTDLNYVSDRSRSIVIRCPVIKYVMTNATQKGKNEALSMSYPNFPARKITKIIGFNQDYLNLNIYNASEIHLENNRFERLVVGMGGTSNSNPNLQLDRSNFLDVAKITMQQKSKLTLDDVIINQLDDMTSGRNKLSKGNLKHFSNRSRDEANINHLEYSLLGDAQINLSGVSLDLIKKR